MSVFLQEMTWQDFENKKNDSIIILPVGSTEQHGPMLPLGVDAIIATGLAQKVAESVGGIVAPTLNYGYKSAPLSGGGPLFPGTIDLNGTTLIDLVRDILEEFILDGVKRLFVLNGHYENEAFVLEAIDLVSRKYDDVTIIESSWWDQISQEVMDYVFDEVSFPGWALEHAAIAETSLVQYFKPELVRWERYVEDGVDEELTYQIYPAHKCNVPPTGLLSTAKSSSPEKGKRMVEDIVEKYVKILNNTMK
jgi:creatinine amidohydrolase